MDRISRLEDFLTQNPADSFVRHALALEMVKAGRDDEARRLWEALLADDENYVGSYYHLGKLLERAGDTAGAQQCYEKGMTTARAAGDNHAYNELQAALENLTD